MTWLVTVWEWVSGHRAITGAIVGGLLLTAIGGLVVHRCHQRELAAEDAARAAEVARLKEEATLARGRAEAREQLAEDMALIAEPLVDAGARAAARVEEAKRVEAEQKDAGANDSVGDMLEDLVTVFK